MTVVVVKRHNVDSWNAGPPTFAVVASDVDAAKRWIQDEVDEKHGSGHTYAEGKSADWWILYGIFSLTEVELQT